MASVQILLIFHFLLYVYLLPTEVVVTLGQFKAMGNTGRKKSTGHLERNLRTDILELCNGVQNLSTWSVNGWSEGVITAF